MYSQDHTRLAGTTRTCLCFITRSPELTARGCH